MYKRVVLKFSGEQLAGKHEFGVDPEVARFIARQCKQILDEGCQVVLVVGGGNLIRGSENTESSGIRRVTADHMGMLSGLMNALALTDIFESEHLPTRCMSNIFATQIVESYSFRLAENHLHRGRIVIVAGGISRPFFTHDTAAVSIGLELGCELVLKATKVDGVYTKDPLKFADATRFERLTFQDALENDAIKVMDKAALGLAMEQQMPVLVLNTNVDGNVARAVRGESVGTLIAD